MLLNLALPQRAGILARRLSRCSSGLALIEFAFTLPLVLAMGGYGIEISNLALAHLRTSQYALEVADNMSRVGTLTSLSVEQLRESDVNDVFQGLRLEGKLASITTYGRITVSSLENVQQSYDSAPVQRIHWQRCIGLKSGAGYDSSYGTTSITAGSDATVVNAGTTMTAGMGDAGAKVNAPAGSAVIFVEINYDYQSLFGTMFVPKTKLHYVASFIVRDKRDFSRIFNPTPAAIPSTCALYTS
jgi:Flp pilus assembly protein TadG